MQKRAYLPTIILSLFFAVLFFIGSSLGWFNFLTNGISWTLFSLGKVVTAPFVHTPTLSPLEALKEENARLSLELAKDKTVAADNTALRDQFQTTTPSPQKLLPATIVGRPGALPNVSFPETFVIAGGSKNGVKKGMPLIVKQSLIGEITKTTDYYAQASVVSSKGISFPAKDVETGAIGIVKGQGNGELLLDNVLLSDNVKVGDTIVSEGSQTISGEGIPPGLIIGKVTGIDKNPSNLFQQARIGMLVALDRLSQVFVKVN